MGKIIVNFQMAKLKWRYVVWADQQYYEREKMGSWEKFFLKRSSLLELSWHEKFV